MANKNQTYTPANLNKDGGSPRYLKAIEKGTPNLSLNKIYTDFYKHCKNNNINMAITMLEISDILKNKEVRNSEKNYKIVFHHQGTTYYANEVFFMEKIKSLKKMNATKEDGMDEIIKILNAYNIDKLNLGIKIKNAQNKLKNRFINNVIDLFSDTLKRRHKKYELEGFKPSVHKLIKEWRYDFDRLEILKILNNYKYLISSVDDKNYLEKLLKEISIEMKANNFAKYFSMDTEYRKKMMSNFDKYRLSLDTLGSGLAKSYENAFKEILKEGYNSKEIENIINKTTKRKMINEIYENRELYPSEKLYGISITNKKTNFVIPINAIKITFL